MNRKEEVGNPYADVVVALILLSIIDCNEVSNNKNSFSFV